jgi:hypothetical protein
MRTSGWLIAGLVAGTTMGVACDAPPSTTEESHAELLTGNGDFRTETLNLPWLGVRQITYEMVNGQAVFEGDIILDLDRLRIADADASRSAGRRNEAARWIGGVIPFTIDATLSANDTRITTAISHWQANTGITFVPRTSQGDFVLFQNPSGNKSCTTSNIGRTTGTVVIKLATACSAGNAIHEIGHAVGLFHEQSRSDRDTWVTVNWANINAAGAGQFDTYVQMGSDGVDSAFYDFGSVMGYDSFAFSANGLPTMVKKDGSTFTSQRDGLSAEDIKGVGRMYPRFNSFTDNMPTIASNFGPSITSWAKNRLDVLAVGTDGSLRHQFSNDGGASWSGWVDNWGGVLTSGVDAVSWGVNRLDVVGKGTNNSIFHFWYDNGNTGWEDLGMQMKFDPGISSWSGGNLDIFCVGTDNAQKHRAFRSDGWHGWENLGGILTAGIDAVSWGVNRIDMVSRNSNSKVVHKAWDGSGWSSWTDRGGSLSGSTPTIASHSNGHFDIFATFVDGNVWKRSYELAWELDFGKVGGAITEPDALSDAPGRFDMVGLIGGNVRHGSIRNN